MKIRIGASLKSGLPNYGSLGSSAEIELTLDDEITVEQAISAMRVWQKAADQAVEDEQARKAARYPGPHNIPQPTAVVAPARQPDPLPPAAQPREPRRWNPDDLPPPQIYEPIPSPAPERARNGGGAPPRNGSNGRDDRPRNGKQLLGWASSHGKYEELQALGKQHRDRGRIVEWSDDMVQWAYNDLSRPVGAGWGDGGRN